MFEHQALMMYTQSTSPRPAVVLQLLSLLFGQSQFVLFMCLSLDISQQQL